MSEVGSGFIWAIIFLEVSVTKLVCRHLSGTLYVTDYGFKYSLMPLRGFSTVGAALGGTVVSLIGHCL